MLVLSFMDIHLTNYMAYKNHPYTLIFPPTPSVVSHKLEKITLGSSGMNRVL